jgi:glycosyltransferase involved in cell wall biosynthesis
MPAQEAKRVTVVVPFLNEAENLPVLYEQLCAVMAGQPERFEVICVDDGSTDGSAEWVAALALPRGLTGRRVTPS